MSEILVITQYATSRNSSTGYYWQQIIDHLTSCFDVTLITQEQDGVSELSVKNLFLVKVWKNKYLPLKVHKAIEKIISTIKIAYAAIIHSDKEKAILIGTNPFLIVLIIPILKFRGAPKIVLLVYDIFPENLVSLYDGWFTRLIIFLLKPMFNYCYRACDVLLSIGRDMSETLISKGCLEDKITLCTNWGDLATNIDIGRREALIKFKLEEYEEKLIIQYFGNIGKLQNISFILNAITKSKNKDLLFLFVGQGSEVKEVKKYAKECSKIIHLDSVELHQRDMVLQACDIAIVSLKNEMKGLAVPSKSYFSLSSNKPIITIAHEKSEVALMVEEMNAGWVCSPTDDKQLISLLDELSFAKVSKFRNLKSIVEDYYNPSARLSLIESTMKIH